VVTFADLETKEADGVRRAPITGGDVQEMAAEFVRIAPGKRLAGAVPQGSDCYLFALGGIGVIAAAGAHHPLVAQTFATVQEGQRFEIENNGSAPLELVRVLAPPSANGKFPGFADGVRVAARAATPIHDVAAEKKRRIYFVGHGAAHSERGHAMIVMYQKETVTGLHHHPNAESMFVPLDGALQFTVNGAKVRVAPGQAAYFAMNDTHGLHVADDASGASFLEFHIPAAFTTVRP
jgi:mannose-6-phosphate isomerase-like protein (cupin superfamily)